MFCFRCKTDYQRGILHCSRCRSALVYRFPSQRWISYSDRKLVLLRRYKGQFAGEVAEMTLKAAGIESLLIRGDRGNTPPLSFEGSAETFVRSEDVEDAQAILSADMPEPL
jgi:hypothetical protein